MASNRRSQERDDNATYHNKGKSEIWKLMRPEEVARATVQAVARLKAGVDIRQAGQEANALAASLAAGDPDASKNSTVEITFVRSEYLGNVERALYILLAASGLMLFCSIANVANLLLVSGFERTRDFAIRLALGASRPGLIWQLVLERIPLIATCVSVIIAYGEMALFNGMDINALPRVERLSLDSHALAFAIGACTISILGSVIVSAVHILRTDTDRALKTSSNRATEGSSGQFLRKALIVGQVALSLILFNGAGILLRTYTQLSRTNLGFRPENVLSASLTIPPPHFSDQRILSLYIDQMVQAVGRIPGVISVGATTTVPLSGLNLGLDAYPVRASEPGARPLNVQYRIVTPGYFESLTIPVLRGRAFTQADNETSEPVVVINRYLASIAFPNENPIGQQIRIISVAPNLRGPGPEYTSEWLMMCSTAARTRNQHSIFMSRWHRMLSGLLSWWPDAAFQPRRWQGL
jgi:putative ABC transport system permease protein